MFSDFTYEGVNYRFYGSQGEHIFRFLGHPNFYEFDLLKYITSLNIEGIYIDVGANIGNHSVYFANHCPSMKVISFEPEKECFYYLQLNMKTNSLKEFDLHNLGVWDGNRRGYLKRFPSHKNMGQSRLVDMSDYEVELVSLDSFIDEEVGLIKIDIEGGEERVIKGARNTITRDKPTIICEASESGEKAVLDELLGTLGYAPARLRFNATPTYVWER